MATNKLRKLNEKKKPAETAPKREKNDSLKAEASALPASAKKNASK
jgi:hypothetical protein